MPPPDAAPPGPNLPRPGGAPAGSGPVISSIDLAGAKRDLRVSAAERRRQAALAAPAAGAGVRDEFLAGVPVAPAAPVSGYWPLPEELDCRPLLRALYERGHPIGLPVVEGRGLPLMFRRWRPGSTLVAGAFRVATPSSDAEPVVPAVVLAPLLAFDRAGYRLGYGGGFFDRTIARLRAAGPLIAVGLGFAAQEVPEVPRGPGDEPLDWIVSEREAILVARPRG